MVCRHYISAAQEQNTHVHLPLVQAFTSGASMARLPEDTLRAVAKHCAETADKPYMKTEVYDGGLAFARAFVNTCLYLKERRNVTLTEDLKEFAVDFITAYPRYEYGNTIGADLLNIAAFDKDSLLDLIFTIEPPKINRHSAHDIILLRTLWNHLTQNADHSEKYAYAQRIAERSAREQIVLSEEMRGHLRSVSLNAEEIYQYHIDHQRSLPASERRISPSYLLSRFVHATDQQVLDIFTLVLEEENPRRCDLNNNPIDSFYESLAWHRPSEGTMTTMILKTPQAFSESVERYCAYYGSKSSAQLVMDAALKQLQVASASHDTCHSTILYIEGYTPEHVALLIDTAPPKEYGYILDKAQHFLQDPETAEIITQAMQKKFTECVQLIETPTAHHALFLPHISCDKETLYHFVSTAIADTNTPPNALPIILERAIASGLDTQNINTTGNSLIHELILAATKKPSIPVANCIKTLLHHNADPIVVNDDGKTALDLATEHNCTQAFSVLDDAFLREHSSVYREHIQRKENQPRDDTSNIARLKQDIRELQTVVGALAGILVRGQRQGWLPPSEHGALDGIVAGYAQRQLSELQQEHSNTHEHTDSTSLEPTRPTRTEKGSGTLDGIITRF